MKIYKNIIGVIFSLCLFSCEKNAVQDINTDPPQSIIKFFHFGVNAPGVNFYANDNKVTAISSATGVESTTGTNYGGVGNVGLYSAIVPGQYTFKAKIAATTDKDLAIANIAGTIENGKFYSLYLSGVYNTTAKTIDGFVIEDAVPGIDTATAHVRFVNAISNAGGPMTLFAKNTITLAEIAAGGEVVYKTGGAFTAIPPGVYDLNSRYTGSTSNIITRLAVTFLKGRVYTIGARGQIGSSTAVPALDNTLNR